MSILAFRDPRVSFSLILFIDWFEREKHQFDVPLIYAFIGCFFPFPFLKNSFLESREGRKKERERNINAWFPLYNTRVSPLTCPLLRDMAFNPGRSPNWESNPRLFGSQAGTQPTEPHQPGHGCFLYVLWLLMEPSTLEYWDDNPPRVCDPLVFYVKNMYRSRMKYTSDLAITHFPCPSNSTHWKYQAQS